MREVSVGLVGSGFVSAIHAAALRMVPGARLAAVCSPTEEHVRRFAQEHAIPRWFTDYRRLLELGEVEVIVIGAPNDLHAEMAVAAAEAGKHVICEKPLCLNLAEADRMIAACRRAGVKLMYAEELCFAPKYVRLKQLVEEGAVGELTLIKQSEKHDGPHASWFWDVERSGGGVAMDMGCHALEFFRWMTGKRRAEWVWADLSTQVHRERTRGDDNALLVVRFEGGITALAEESWTKKGGMDDRAEVYGSLGVAYADLLRGNSILTYSETGYGYAVEKASTTRGWSFAVYEEIWNYGFPQEMAHFVECVREDKEPLETGEDGRAVLEMIFAAYESARTGCRVKLPFPTQARKPVELWHPQGVRQEPRAGSQSP